jgi:single-strand DNA-binding protein
VAQYLTKGKQIYVEGRLSSRSYDDKDGNKKYVTEVVADDVLLLSSQGGRGGEAPADEAGEAGPRPVSMPRSAQRPAPPAVAPAAATPAPTEDFPPGITDDDVPF